MIMEMDRQMHDVEDLMGNIGQNCNTKLMERKSTNLKAWMKEIRSKGAATIRNGM